MKGQITEAQKLQLRQAAIDILGLTERDDIGIVMVMVEERSKGDANLSMQVLGLTPQGLPLVLASALEQANTQTPEMATYVASGPSN